MARSDKDNQRRDEITAETLLRAYSIGMFPMADSAEDPSIFWVKPKLRGVIPLDTFHIPRSLSKTIKRGTYDIRINTAFEQVVEKCAEAAENRESTWINATIKRLYADMHRIGHAHSVEAWHEGELVGGLYGVTLGAAFFGESMFSRMTDASKVCLVELVARLRQRGFVLLDTQFTTSHLERFGAIEVPQRAYDDMLQAAIAQSAQFADADQD